MKVKIERGGSKSLGGQKGWDGVSDTRWGLVGWGHIDWEWSGRKQGRVVRGGSVKAVSPTMSVPLRTLQGT